MEPNGISPSMASHADAGHATQDTSARSSPEYLELLAKVAHLYYEQGLNQRQIAAQIDRHASTISRLLEEARSEGIVRISVQYPWRSDDELASRLAATFQLRHAHVLLSEGMPYQKMVDGLGVIAARVLAGALHDGTILGVSWGSAVHSSIQALRVPTPVRVTVVQMCGAVGASVTGGVELPRMAAERCGGTYRYLPAPVAVKDPRLAQSLLAEPMVDEVLQLAARADVALVGIGSINPQVSQWLRNGYADSFELTELEQLGYVGDVCGRFFTAEGDVLDSELNQRVIAVPAERLRGIPHVIGVAGGELKVPAIRGALRARLINSLVTDSSAARQLLAMP